MSILTLPKIDAHCHVLDPARFAYGADVAYKPAGQEQGTLAAYRAIMDCYAVRHALLVGPNSGYGTDNRCLLDALSLRGANGERVFKGVAVVANDCPTDELQRLQTSGVIGIAFNAALHGFAFYSDIAPLLARLAALGMWAQLQVEGSQLAPFLPMLKASGVKVLIDHCARPPLPSLQLGSEPLEASLAPLFALRQHNHTVVKLSGFAKFSQTGLPFADARPVVDALVQQFGLAHCVWASDWPYLKAPQRLDYGPMLKAFETLFSTSDLRTLMWDSPKQHFGF